MYSHDNIICGKCQKWHGVKKRTAAASSFPPTAAGGILHLEQLEQGRIGPEHLAKRNECFSVVFLFSQAVRDYWARERERDGFA